MSTENTVGIYYPQNYHLESVRLITLSGESIDLRKILRELSVHEDIFSFSVSGYVKVEDGLGLIDAYGLTGEEYIHIIYGKSEDDPHMHNQVYKLYKLADRAPSGNFMSEYYTLYFCSDELILSEQMKISKAYKGYQVNDIIYDILFEQMQVPADKIVNIQDTMGLYDFVVPRFKPFEAISWVSNYARPSVGKGADMLFFETKEGFSFRSLQDMYKQDSFRTFKFQQKNLNDKQQPLEEKMKTIISFEFPKGYDVLEGINSGAFANKLVSLDPIQRNVKVTRFNGDKYGADTETTSLNDFSLIGNFKNRLDRTLTSSSDGNFKLATGNSKQSEDDYLSSTESATKDIFIEEYVPNRTAQIAKAMLTTMKIVVPGYPGLMVGQVVEVFFPSTQTLGDSGTIVRSEDKKYSGRYLITALRHIIQPSVSAYQTILELSKDSGKEGVTTVDNGDPDIQALAAGTGDWWA